MVFNRHLKAVSGDRVVVYRAVIMVAWDKPSNKVCLTSQSLFCLQLCSYYLLIRCVWNRSKLLMINGVDCLLVFFEVYCLETLRRDQPLELRSPWRSHLFLAYDSLCKVLSHPFLESLPLHPIQSSGLTPICREQSFCHIFVQRYLLLKDWKVLSFLLVVASPWFVPISPLIFFIILEPIKKLFNRHHSINLSVDIDGWILEWHSWLLIKWLIHWLLIELVAKLRLLHWFVPHKNAIAKLVANLAPGVWSHLPLVWSVDLCVA